jgi:hypothetical protein
LKQKPLIAKKAPKSPVIQRIGSKNKALSASALQTLGVFQITAHSALFYPVSEPIFFDPETFSYEYCITTRLNNNNLLAKPGVYILPLAKPINNFKELNI